MYHIMSEFSTPLPTAIPFHTHQNIAVPFHSQQK